MTVLSRACALVLIGLLGNLPASAQQPPVLGTPDVQWAAHVYKPGLQEALFTIDLLPEHIVCDQALPSTPQGLAMIAWEDWHLPAGSGKWCLWIDGPPGPLRNIVPGTYELGLTATVDGVDHPESVRYTFVKKGDEMVFIIARNVRVL